MERPRSSGSTMLGSASTMIPTSSRPHVEPILYGPHLERVSPRLNREGIPLWRQMGESIGIDSACGGRVDGQGLFFRYAPARDWAG